MFIFLMTLCIYENCSYFIEDKKYLLFSGKKKNHYKSITAQ